MEKTLTDEQAIALISSTICPSTTEDETARSVAKYAIFATMDSLGFNGLWLLNDFQPLLNAVYDLHSEIAPNWYSIDGIDYIIGSYDANHIVIIIESNNEFYWQTSGKHWGVEKTLVQAKANGARALSAEFTTNMPCPNDKLPDKPFNIKLYPSAHHDLIMSSTICQQLIRHESKKETKTSTENSNKNTETEKIKETNMESVSEVIDSDIIDPEFSNTNDNDIYTQKISLENLAYSNDEDEVSNSGSNTETNECNPETENLDSNISDNNPLTEKKLDMERVRSQI